MRILRLCRPVSVLAVCFAALVARAQPGHVFQPVGAESPVLQVAAEPVERVVAVELVEFVDANWLRVKLGDVQLPSNAIGSAFLRLTSLQDGAWQRLDAAQLSQWQGHSAYFNGSQVLIELVVPAGVSGKARLAIDGVILDDANGQNKSICDGTDGRAAFEHPAIARVMPIRCTAWLIDTCNKCLVTAGHCTNGAASVVQFNVPPSLPDGTLVFPGPEDQYAIDGQLTESTGLGDPGTEFGLLQVHPNPNTNLMPFESQSSAFGLADEIPLTGSSVRVAGYGTDETLHSDPGVNNYALTSHDAAVVNATISGVEYRADSTGGNSGSPVIDAATGKVVAIHTHGGCNSVNGNRGTSVNKVEFRDALVGLGGPCVCPGLAISPISLPPVVMLPRHPAPVVVSVIRPGQSGEEVEAQWVRLDWEIESGPRGSSYLDKGVGGVWAINLPGIECGEMVRYSLTASVDSELVTWPAEPDEQEWAVSGWTVLEVKSYDFETDPKWQVQSLGTTEGEWGIGVPTNEPAKLTPPADADGSGNCWLTGPLAGNNDVDGGPTMLITEWFKPFEGEAIILNYARYFANDDRDDFLRVEVQIDGSDWTLVESVDSDPLWRTIRVPVRSSRQPQKPLRVRYTVSDDPNNSITEAAIDAFRIESVSCDVACAADLNGDGIVDFDDFLAWLELAGIPYSRGDLNGDGATDELDFFILLSQLYRQCSLARPRPVNLDTSNEPLLGS